MISTHTTNNQKIQPLSPPKSGAVCLHSCTKAFNTVASGKLFMFAAIPTACQLLEKENLTRPLSLTLIPIKDVGYPLGLSCAASEEGRLTPDIGFEETQYFSLCFTGKNQPAEQLWSRLPEGNRFGSIPQLQLRRS